MQLSLQLKIIETCCGHVTLCSGCDTGGMECLGGWGEKAPVRHHSAELVSCWLNWDFYGDTTEPTADAPVMRCACIWHYN